MSTLEAHTAEPAAQANIESLRLLMLNSTPEDVFGGVEQWMLRASLGLMERSHTVHAVGRKNSIFLSKLREGGIPVHPGRSGMDFDPFRAVHIARIARSEGLELAIINYNKELSQVALARRWSPIKKVVGRSVLPMIDRGPRHRRLYRKHLDGMITPSREVKRIVEGYPWMSNTQIQNIPNGIDLSRVERADREYGGRHPTRERMELSPDSFVVGAVGRLEKHKGFHHLIAAFGTLAKEVEKSALVIVGAGSEESRLREQAGRLYDLSRPVHFTGHVTDVDSILPAFDVLVLPSTTEYETFGQSLIEAMAFNIPVIGSCIGGIPEVVSDGETGLLVPPGDEEALTRALLKLAGDGELRSNMARAGRRKVEECFSEDIMLDRLESCLSEILRTP